MNRIDQSRSSVHKPLLPLGWKRPKGYSNAVCAKGQILVTAGLVGWDEQENFQHAGFVAQLEQILANLRAILDEAGSSSDHIVRMTWYILDKDEYIGSLREIGEVYRKFMGKNFPAMAVVQVLGLIEPEARLEIEVMAVIPDPTT